MRRTKILATLGPATFAPQRIARLLNAGADGLRINFSHGTDAQHREILGRVNRIRRRLGLEVALVADLQGPKIRLGPLRAGAVRLRDGAPFRLDTSGRTGDARGASVSLPALVGAAGVGDRVLLGDGTVVLAVERTERSGILTRVEHGGLVPQRAGVYLPGARLRADVLGPKDIQDLDIALEGGADYVAVSFVRDARDIRSVRRELGSRPDGSDVGLIAKIERAEALRHIDAILESSDAIMVARGDLGIEVPLERIASEQKRLLVRAAAWGRPAIVATQMLESLVSQPRPTRAEATDVANAVLDGADALMLSEESAVGRFPFEAVAWLDRIARATEPSLPRRDREPWAGAPGGRTSSERAVAASAVELAERLGAGAIVTPTQTGRTAELVASGRPRVPVWALSSVDSVRRRASLVWGIRAFPCAEHVALVDLRAAAVRIATEAPEPLASDRIVLTAGYPVEGRPTNLVTVIEIPHSPPRRDRGRPGAPRPPTGPRRARRDSAEPAPAEAAARG